MAFCSVHFFVFHPHCCFAFPVLPIGVLLLFLSRARLPKAVRRARRLMCRERGADTVELRKTENLTRCGERGAEGAAERIGG